MFKIKPFRLVTEIFNHAVNVLSLYQKDFNFGF